MNFFFSIVLIYAVKVNGLYFPDLNCRVVITRVDLSMQVTSKTFDCVSDYNNNKTKHDAERDASMESRV